jgi:hypothetical protein
MVDVILHPICDRCHKEVADGEGHLFVDKVSAYNLEQGKPKLLWRVAHTLCDQKAADSARMHSIDSRKVRTIDQLRNLQDLELDEKPWLASTDWAEFVQEVVAGTSLRLARS